MGAAFGILRPGSPPAPPPEAAAPRSVPAARAASP